MATIWVSKIGDNEHGPNRFGRLFFGGPCVGETQQTHQRELRLRSLDEALERGDELEKRCTDLDACFASLTALGFQRAKHQAGDSTVGSLCDLCG